MVSPKCFEVNVKCVKCNQQGPKHLGEIPAHSIAGRSTDATGEEIRMKSSPKARAITNSLYKKIRGWFMCARDWLCPRCHKIWRRMTDKDFWKHET